jgi:putative membrane protein
VRFAVDPVVLALLGLACVLYVRALGIVRARGLHVSRLQQACWWTGIGLLTIGLNGPLDAYDDVLLSAHMAQHQVIGDLAAPFLLAGVRAPLLLFYLPRPALVTLARRHWLRAAFRFARQPLVALPLYVLTVYAWHYGTLFEGALRHPLLHALQHECFLLANLLLWWPVLEPARRRMDGQLWKIGYIFAARMSTMFLGMVFLFSRGVLYEGVYGRGPREGLSALSDQQTAGGMMMSLDIVIMAIAACWFFWLASREYDRSEEPTLPGGASSPVVASSDSPVPPAQASSCVLATNDDPLAGDVADVLSGR